MINKNIINMCAEKNDSFYLYDESTILGSIQELRDNFPQIEFLYSIKCNPHPEVLKSIFSQQFGADAASAGEVRLARAAGLDADRIFYSAPGKSVKDIENTIDNAMLIADSINEIKRIQSVAEAAGRIVKIGIRINPDFSFAGDDAQPSKFGIDENQAMDFVQSGSCKNIKIAGIHVHLKSQQLNARALSDYYKKILQLAQRFTEALGKLEYVNMGSGMGVQYSPADLPLDIETLGRNVQNSLDEFCSTCPGTRMIMEVGRYAVCKSGIYVTRVMDRKVSRGRTYIILKNTLNGFIRPSVAKTIEHCSSDENPAESEPLFTCRDAFEIIPLKETGDAETVTLVGNLCTATDVIAEDISLQRLECGDLLAITNAGGYAAVLSPMQFSTQEKPEEFFVTASGEVL